jgi:hypothetical protein
MISFSNIHKQYGKQLIFVTLFQLNPREGRPVGPAVRGRRPCSAWWSARADGVFRFRGSWQRYFRQDVEEMKSRSVLDEAIAVGPLGDLHHELADLHHAM